MREIKTVLSLFDGMSCGQIALNRLGIIPDKYFASEIDKYAIQVTQKNFPKTIQLGDVNNWPFWELIPEFAWDSIDLLIGGSPCQDLSIAKQNRQGLEGKRSGLFWRYVEILKKAKPKYFLLENVASMKNSDKDIISEILGVEPVMINSALLSAQQRKRYYWTNIPFITQPRDKGIYLKDIIETGGATLTDKSYCLTGNYSKKSVRDIPKGNTLIIEPVVYQLPRGKNGGGIKKEKAPTMTSNAWEHNNLCIEPLRVGHFGKGGQSQRIYSANGKSVCLGTGGATKENYLINIPNNDYVIRKLTPLECERLQTVPEGYTSCVSNTQRYRMLGNGWTVDVIAHIFKSILLEDIL